jgi:Na+-transporting NADH:ubiquinone oxidoreductase subunit C
MEIERQKNVLKAFGFDCTGKKQAEISSLYKENIKESVSDNNGRIIEGRKPSEIGKDESGTLLPLYTYVSNNEVKGYSIPISGRALWSKCYGYFALGKDLNTVLGITFYQHGETPGLGGEIEASWFQDNFRGKKILDSSGGLRSITIVKGQVSSLPDKSAHIHSVDGISGATMTCDGVNLFLRSDLERYESLFTNLRKGLK